MQEDKLGRELALSMAENAKLIKQAQDALDKLRVHRELSEDEPFTPAQFLRSNWDHQRQLKKAIEAVEVSTTCYGQSI